MDSQARGAIIGMVFGDAYLNIRKRLMKNKNVYESSEMRIVHGIAQKDYCEHKAALIKKYLGGNFNVVVGKNGKDGKYVGASFSASNPYFKLIKKWTHPEGKFTFTKFALDFLTEEGIAIWYMDDGHARRNYNKDGYVSSVQTDIATMCSKQEVETIIEWFADKYDIIFKPRFDKRCSDGNNWFISCNTENSHNFARIVQPYIIESMMYKLAHVADLSSHECRAPIAICAKCSKPIYDGKRKGLCSACYHRKYYKTTRKHL